MTRRPLQSAGHNAKKKPPFNYLKRGHPKNRFIFIRNAYCKTFPFCSKAFEFNLSISDYSTITIRLVAVLLAASSW